MQETISGAFSERKNIDFIWLFQGEKVPDYSSFARFRSRKAKEVVEDLFYQLVKKLSELEETEYEEVFIDGTKIASMANRYTFVWKNSVEPKIQKAEYLLFRRCSALLYLFLESSDGVFNFFRLCYFATAPFAVTLISF